MQNVRKLLIGDKAVEEATTREREKERQREKQKETEKEKTNENTRVSKSRSNVQQSRRVARLHLPPRVLAYRDCLELLTRRSISAFVLFRQLVKLY